MNADSLSKQFFNFGDEREARREIVFQSREGEVCGLETAGEGAGVVGFWGRNFLGGDEGFPEGVGGERLCDAV